MYSILYWTVLALLALILHLTGQINGQREQDIGQRHGVNVFWTKFGRIRPKEANLYVIFMNVQLSY